MIDDLSPAVERALETARKQAGDAPVNAVQLLLALIEDDEGRAAQLLIDAGGDIVAIRDVLAGHHAVKFDMPAVLTSAREAAGERDETTLTGEYLLVGLIRANVPFHEPLRQSGVAVDRLIRRVELPPIAMGFTLDLRDPTDIVSSARAVDANANRAREALRVLDDYVRFVLDDGVLTAAVKGLRHDLAGLLDQLPASLLNEARETLWDVGTGIMLPGEMTRHSPADVARINLKRLQEALRSLEEYGKVLQPQLVPGLEAIRYRSYTVERIVGIGTDARSQLENAKVYVLLSGSGCLAAVDWTIREAADGGADIFQLREKSLNDRELIERARNVRRWTRETHTLFIMNDRPDIARLVEADGVHLGQDDMSVKDARRILGHGPLIGVSTHTPEQVRKAVVDGASYIGVGPTFASTTKDFKQLAGLEFVRQATAMTTLPAFVIGGVGIENVAEAVAAGAKRVAVGAALCQAEEPGIAAARLRAALP
ncbi:MAG TPA: thiamine phosphate synthase [Gemmataceae bacterium]|jgi:thiamine-phosphate pyrophosphorylase|nr:thiamine phosphate synthase [Gemmataceae bacterium]